MRRFTGAMTFEQTEAVALRIALQRKVPLSAVIAAASYVGLHSPESVGRFLDATGDAQHLDLHHHLHRAKPGTKGIIE